jgi:ribosomal protein L6P/L9E
MWNNKKISKKFVEKLLYLKIPENVALKVVDSVEYRWTTLEFSLTDDSRVKIQVKYPTSYVSVTLENNLLKLDPIRKDKKTWAILNSLRNNINQRFQDLKNSIEVKLKYEFNSFSITISKEPGVCVVKNYLGSKKDLRVKVSNNVEYSYNDGVMYLKSHDRNAIGVMKSRLKDLRRLSKFALNMDKRKFIDGFYMEK